VVNLLGFRFAEFTNFLDGTVCIGVRIYISTRVSVTHDDRMSIKVTVSFAAKVLV